MLLTVLPTLASAAGGHHDVDDAVTLDPGHCQVETWAVEARHPTIKALHLGPACRLGPIEWGLTVDRLRIDGEGADNAGPQAKWVFEVWPQRLNVGLASGFVKRFRGDTRPLVTTYVPITAWLGEGGPLQLHVNLGQDREPALGVMRRWGVGADWAVNDRWVLTAERRKFLEAALTRGGVRFNLTPLSSLDLSYARGPLQRVWVLGFTQEWGS